MTEAERKLLLLIAKWMIRCREKDGEMETLYNIAGLIHAVEKRAADSEQSARLSNAKESL
jgi:hypothetical protein